MIGKDTSPDVGKGTQFQPGQSGNPAGPAPGTVHLSTHIQKALNDAEFTVDLVKKDGSKVTFKGMPVEAIIKTAITKAMSGDKQWADWLSKYGYGSKIVHSNDPDNPITPPEPADPEREKAFVEFFKIWAVNGNKMPAMPQQPAVKPAPAQKPSTGTQASNGQ